MQRIINNIHPQLLFNTRASFSQMLFDPASNPIKERVMSTPTWPVPYYQRLTKAYPIRCTNSYHSETKTVQLSMCDFVADDTNWVNAKRVLNMNLKGRHIVEYTENHLNTNSKEINI